MSLLIAHGLVRVSLSLNDLPSNSIEFVDGNDCGTFVLLSVARAHGVDTAWIG